MNWARTNKTEQTNNLYMRHLFIIYKAKLQPAVAGDMNVLKFK